MLYTYLGIISFISRHLFCKLGDLKNFNRFYLYQGGMTISGLCVVCLPLASQIIWLYCGYYGSVWTHGGSSVRAILVTGFEVC